MMDEITTRKYQMLSRVRDFGATHPELFPTGSASARLLAGIGSIVDALSAISVAHVQGGGTAREASRSKAAFREAVRDAVETVARIARSMEAETPGFSNRFRVPASKRDQALLDAAKAFLADSQPLRPRFAEWELGEEFWAQMGQEVAAFESSMLHQERGVTSRKAAGQALDERAAEGLRLVRRISPLVHKKVKHDPLLLAAWESSVRVRGVSRVPLEEEPDGLGKADTPAEPAA